LSFSVSTYFAIDQSMLRYGEARDSNPGLSFHRYVSGAVIDYCEQRKNWVTGLFNHTIIFRVCRSQGIILKLCVRVKTTRSTGSIFYFNRWNTETGVLGFSIETYLIISVQLSFFRNFSFKCLTFLSFTFWTTSVWWRDFLCYVRVWVWEHLGVSVHACIRINVCECIVDWEWVHVSAYVFACTWVCASVLNVYKSVCECECACMAFSACDSRLMVPSTREQS